MQLIVIKNVIDCNWHGRKSWGGHAPPPPIWKTGDIILNVPPPPLPTILGCIMIFFVLVREVGDVQWVPLLCVWKIEKKNFEVGKKKCRSPPTPAHQLFPDLHEFRGWRQTDKKKKVCPPMIWFGFAPMVHVLN